jgi:hypothetical protein
LGHVPEQVRQNQALQDISMIARVKGVPMLFEVLKSVPNIML